jgi:phosphate transport system substrate-binding protein
MKNLQCGIRVLALLALFATGLVLMAQEATQTPAEATAEATLDVTTAPESTAAPESTLEVTAEVTAVPSPEVAGGSATVVGSGIVNPVVQSLITASGSTVNFTVTTTGTDSGFDQFCAGTADIATSIRTISTEEDAACQAAGVEYMELLIGFDVMVFVSNNQDNFLACLTGDNINALFAPSANPAVWSDIALQTTPTGAPMLAPTPLAEATAEATAEVTPEVTAEPLPSIVLYVPADNTLTYATLENLVAGFGIRNSVVSSDYATIISNVRNTRGALGVVSLEAALAPDSGVIILPVDFAGDTTGCETPSVAGVEAGTYPASTPLYVYVKKASQPTLNFFLNYITDVASVSEIGATGFSPASAETYATNRSVILGEIDGRAFSAEEAEFIIPANLAGTINIVGSPEGFRIIDTTKQQFAQTQQGLVINSTFNGDAAGMTDFCTGTADILFVRGDGSNLCQGLVDYVPFSLGYQSAVLVANAADSYASCLSLEQISTLWSGASANVVTNWNALGASFPDQALTLVAPREGSYLSDILLTPASGGAPAPVRVDVAETNNDPLYRSAAIAIVPGSLTYMSWADYEKVLTNAQQGIQLVAINNGTGCVVPSETSIMDGSYPLSRQLSMVVKTSSLASDGVQSLLWTIFQDSNFALFTASGLSGYTVEDFAQIRADLLVSYAAAKAAAAALAEATAEATGEATAEATGEATAEATQAQ